VQKKGSFAASNEFLVALSLCWKIMKRLAAGANANNAETSPFN
jgi:hypothetical protein